MADDYSKMSDDELIKRAESKGIKLPAGGKAETPKIDHSALSDDELIAKAKASGIEVPGEQPNIVEKTPKLPAQNEWDKNPFQLGLEATGHELSGLAGGAALGAAKGGEELYNGAMGLAGVKLPPGANPHSVSDSVRNAYPDIAPTQEAHPGLMGAAQGLGEAIPTLPAWEAGGGIAGAAMKAAQPALKAAGPMGNFLLKTAQAIPGALQNIGKLVMHNTGGAFFAGAQEELAKEGQGGPSKVNMMKVMEAGFQKAEEAAPVAGALGVAGEIAAGVTKIHATSQAKMMTKQAEHQQKLSLNKRTEDLKRDAQIHQQQMQREQQQQDLMQKHRDAEEARIEEMQTALDSQKKRLEHLEGQKMEREKLHAQEQKQHRLSLNKARQEGAGNLGPKTRAPRTPEPDPAVEAEIKRLRGEIDESRIKVLTERKIHASRIRQELEEMKKGKGDPTYVAPQYHGPTPVPAAPSPAVAPVATMESPALSPHGREESEYALLSRMQKGRSNATRSEFDPETGERIGKYKAKDDPWSGLNDNGPILLDENSKSPFLAGGLYGASPEGAGLMALHEMLRTVPKSELTYDGLMHVATVQKDMDILGQYDPELTQTWLKAGKNISDLGGGLQKMFSQTRGKVSFAQMGAGKIDPEILRRGLSDKLTSKEMNALPKEVQRAITESRKAINDYIEKVRPIQKWLNDNAAEVSTHSGLGRLRTTLNGHISDLRGASAIHKGNADRVADAAMALLMKFMFLGKAANAFIHAGEKATALIAKEGLGLGGALAKLHMPGSVEGKFAKQFYAEGPITESFEEQGGKFVMTKAGRIFGATGVERAPQSVASVIGLDKAAAKIGYKSGAELAKDLIAARQGTGPLAHDSRKITDAMATIQDYVSDLTGSNVAGFKDRNVFQRSQKIKIGNMFLGMPGVQARNFHNIIKEPIAAIASKDPKRAAKGALTLGTYLFSLYVVAGDKGPIPKDWEPVVRNTMGASNWYHFMDAVHEARINRFATIPHLQQSTVPLVSGGGASGFDILRKGAQAGAKGKLDPFDAALAGGAMLVGLGGGPALQYRNAVRDGMRGYKVLKVYEHEALGGEKHVADIPVETDVAKSVAQTYFGIHDDEENELEYHAEKSMDLRTFVQQNTSHEEFKDLMEREGDIDAISQVHDLNAEKAATVKELIEEGKAKDSPEVKRAIEVYTKKSAEKGRQLEYFKARSGFWQKRADEIMNKPKAAPAPHGSVV